MEAVLYFLLWAALFFLMMRFGCGAHIMGSHRHGAGSREQASSGAPSELRWVPPAEDTDPVCGKTVRTEKAKSSVYGGTVYYFCSRECREVFEAAPDQYTKADRLGPPKLEQSHA